MLNVVIFGAPGSGKGTQSEKLIEKYGLSHVSTGDLLRAEMKVKSQLGQMAESYMSRGQLVPDDVVVGMLEGLIKKNNHVKGFIFDGFPRTLAQGKALDAMLVKYDEKVNVVLSLEVEDEELIARLLKRGEISGRSDDNKETIESRLRVYYDQTAPLKDFYREQGKLVRIPGQGSVDEIFASMEAVVDRIIV
ncbi:MAG: adenylate kinase [Proteiniphilum sp.]|jgi:adenylate kinase|nr:adenylate kinase [Proteiniphilum sp.]